MKNFDIENFEVLKEKLKKTIKNYNILKETKDKLQVENEFLNKEISKLRKTNFELLEFKIKQQKIYDKIKKVINKIDSLKGI